VTLQELLDKIAEVHIDTGKSATDLEIIIEDDPGVEYEIDNIYYVEGTGIGFDIVVKS
jgi:hypothetical protein